jgi:hypothetical protein
MTWMTMLASEPCESTLVTRTLVSWKCSSWMRSLMAWFLSALRGCDGKLATYLLAYAHADLLLLDARDVLRALVVEELRHVSGLRSQERHNSLTKRRSALLLSVV